MSFGEGGITDVLPANDMVEKQALEISAQQRVILVKFL
jgi:hypothetical protein